MKQISIVPIVEGHGEQLAMRELLTRVWTELLDGEYIEILQPIRGKRQKLVKGDELRKAVGLARLKLRESELPGLVLLVLDADKDLPCELAPEILKMMREHGPDVDVACVLPRPEYETWLVAGADSLDKYLAVKEGDIPDDPEAKGLATGWIERRIRGSKYSKTVDQPRMTAAMDLVRCRERSPSFDKLCRELERWRQRPDEA